VRIGNYNKPSVLLDDLRYRCQIDNKYNTYQTYSRNH